MRVSWHYRSGFGDAKDMDLILKIAFLNELDKIRRERELPHPDAFLKLFITDADELAPDCLALWLLMLGDVEYNQSAYAIPVGRWRVSRARTIISSRASKCPARIPPRSAALDESLRTQTRAARAVAQKRPGPFAPLDIFSGKTPQGEPPRVLAAVQGQIREEPYSNVSI